MLELNGRDEEETADVARLTATIDRFARERIDARALDHGKRIDPDLLGELADLGLFGLSIPTAYGGFGTSLSGVCAVVAALARWDRSVATTVGLHLGLGTRGLVRFGAHELKERLLPELAMGKRIAAFATTEPDAGSDLAALRTRGVDVGGRLRLDGSKIFVTNGALARVYTITAATPGLGGARRGHSLVVTLPEDGVRVGAEEDKLGLRASSTTSLHFDGVEVPLDRVIGTPGEGMAMLHHVLAVGRTAMAAGCVGTATAALDAIGRHVGGRRQFGRPLVAFDVVKEQVAGVAAVRHAMTALVAATTALEADEDALGTRSLATKIFCSEGACEAADVAVQLHGGSGFIEETGVALLLRDARITRIFEGANDVLAVRLGMAAVGGACRREPTGDAAADALAADVDALTADLSRRFGVRVAQEQRELHRLGRLVALREATDAAVRAGGDEAAVWAGMARRRAAAWLDAPLPIAPIARLAATFGGTP